MSFVKAPAILVGHTLNVAKRWSVRCIASHRMIDLNDSAEQSKTSADSQQKVSCRETTNLARKIEEDFKTPGIEDHLQDFFEKEQASYGYSAEVQVYDHGKIISDNVVSVQMNKNSKRISSLMH